MLTATPLERQVKKKQARGPLDWTIDWKSQSGCVECIHAAREQ